MTNQHEANIPQNGNGEKSLKFYLTGYSLSLLFTVLAFGFVYYRLLPPLGLYIGLVVLVLLQLLVQMVCFFRLNARTVEARWNLLSFLFAMFLMVVIIGGSLWIMTNLNYYMVH